MQLLYPVGKWPGRSGSRCSALTPSRPPPIPAPPAPTSQSVRAGKLAKSATTVKLSQSSMFPILDPQGFKASGVVVSKVEIDRPTQTCACKPSKLDQCQCVPDAKLLEGSDTAIIMPQTLVTGGTTARVYYKATVAETGLTCEGFTDVCFAKAKTTCSSFGAKGVQPRSALAC